MGIIRSVAALLTADDLLHWREEGCRLELRRGQLVRRPYHGHEAGVIGGNVVGLLGNHVDAGRLGEVWSGTGFILESDPDTVRAPAVGFVSRERRPPRSQGYLPVAPDLAVEIISPSDTASDVQEKVAEYLAAGSRLVWIIYPRTRSVVIRRATGTGEERRIGQALEGEDVVPGFSCAVAELFPAD